MKICIVRRRAPRNECTWQAETTHLGITYLSRAVYSGDGERAGDAIISLFVSIMRGVEGVPEIEFVDRMYL